MKTLLTILLTLSCNLSFAQVVYPPTPEQLAKYAPSACKEIPAEVARHLEEIEKDIFAIMSDYKNMAIDCELEGKSSSECQKLEAGAWAIYERVALKLAGCHTQTGLTK